jgi:MATE family, multidrug efflux pump
VAEQPDSADISAVDAPMAVPYEGRHLGLPPVTLATVLALSLPAIIEQLIQAAVGLTDTIIAGHIPGDEKTVAAASAAVGVMAYLQWLAGLLNAAFAVGATAIVSRSIGAKRPRVASRVAGTALSGAFVLSMGTALILFVFAGPVAWAAGLRGLAHTYGVQYLHIMTITIAVQAAGMIGMACLRGAGDTLRPMLITAGVATINIFTSSAFSFGLFGAPKWGIQGNAFGTMIAYLLGGSATLVLLLGGWSKLKIQFRHLRLVPHILWRLLRIGTPAWLEGMLLWLGQFLIVVFVISANDKAINIDGATMAAHNTVIRIESLAFLPGFGFGIACSALVGQYLGAGRPDEAQRAARLSTRLAVITMTIAAIPMVLMPRVLLSIMVASPPVVALGVIPMILAGLAQPGFALSITKGSALKGAGDTIWPMISTISGMLLVRVPILAISVLVMRRMGVHGWDLLAVWIGIFADLTFRGLVNWLAFRRGNWRHKRV